MRFTFPIIFSVLFAFTACSKDSTTQKSQAADEAALSLGGNNVPSGNDSDKTSIEGKLKEPQAEISVSKKVISPDPAFFSSHCSHNEVVYLTASMKKINRPKEGGYSTSETGNILSLCIKGESIIYRYGKLGKVDLEKEANSEKPFYRHFSYLGRISLQRTYFSLGNYSYYVTESSGMGSGVSIDVFNKTERIAELFSGDNPKTDFWISANATLPKVSLLEKKPIHKEMQ